MTVPTKQSYVAKSGAKIRDFPTLSIMFTKDHKAFVHTMGELEPVVVAKRSGANQRWRVAGHPVGFPDTVSLLRFAQDRLDMRKQGNG